jgi:VWFA-related protein
MARLCQRHGWSSTLALVVFPSVFLAVGVSNPAAVYRRDVSEVRIIFFTTDEHNRPVDRVQKDDFAVVDSGTVVRDFRSLTRTDETALDVVAVIDASESVAADFSETKDQVLKLVSQNQATGDNLSLISFGDSQTTVICTSNCHNQAAVQRVLAVQAAGATPLFDALAYAANFISRRHIPSVRPVMILFSDGDDTVSKISANDAMRAIISSGALLYSVDLNRSRDVPNGSVLLKRMADASGGRYFSIREGAVNVLQAAMSDLHASYIVSYQLPTRASGFHSLGIFPQHNLGLRFHCRNGYYFETTNLQTGDL